MDQLSSLSPFHSGEQEAQTRAGKRDAMEAVGKIAIRPFMPDQHRQFFEQLPFVVMGSIDAEGWPWASILSGEKGFITSPTDRRLDLAAQPLPDDPLSKAVSVGSPVGLLGIELSTRRRNRMNAVVSAQDETYMRLDVSQSFGNCPQYIQTRDIHFVRAANAPVERIASERFSVLDDGARSFIAQSDTFFVSSYVNPANNPVAEGVDVSHRGGRSGFVKVEGNRLTIPDYSGNNFFNTFGNFLVNPKAGLIFPDFITGNVLMLTGTVEILWEDHPDIADFKGAERGWRFTLDHGIRLHDALPFRAHFGEWSPNSLMADDWPTSMARKAEEERRGAWRTVRLAKVKDESRVIRSFVFEAIDAAPLLSFKAGQHLTLQIKRPNGSSLTRPYSVSSAPGDVGYRISVKREPQGTMSNVLHDELSVGDLVQIKAPTGAFWLDPMEKRPAVLFAGGVGITPMMAMTRHVLKEGVRKRYIRPLTIFHASHSSDQRAFIKDFREAETMSKGKIRYLSILDKINANERQGVDFDARGYITPDMIKAVLAFDDYDFYLCGPPPFMQAIYDMLRKLGAPDDRIFAEAFGPAALQRQAPLVHSIVTPQKVPRGEAKTAVVTFASTGFEQLWQRGDAPLLEIAEAHGLTPDFSCRRGSCGSCATKKLSGTVTYRSPVSATHKEDEVLICCAVPAEGTEDLVLDL